MITDTQHPEVIFIKCLGSLLILDVDNQERITVLDEIRSTVTSDNFFKVAVNKDRMILVGTPNLIEEYDLRRIYTKKEVKLVKNLPTYGFEISPTGDIEFSDVNHLVYIDARDTATNKSCILVYKTGNPAVSTLMEEIKLDKLYSRPGLEI